MTQYSTSSPYYTTKVAQYYLEVMDDRPLPKEQDDMRVKIARVYQYRPDLLAHDVYGDGALWWVFYQRNPNTLTNPPWDFEIGTEIFIPKITTLQRVLGI